MNEPASNHERSVYNWLSKFRNIEFKLLVEPWASVSAALGPKLKFWIAWCLAKTKIGKREEIGKYIHT
jgi:hypothetical protein